MTSVTPAEFATFVSDNNLTEHAVYKVNDVDFNNNDNIEITEAFNCFQPALSDLSETDRKTIATAITSFYSEDETYEKFLAKCYIGVRSTTNDTRGDELVALIKNGHTDFRFVDLDEIDLSNQNLNGVDFTGGHCMFSDLSGAKLKGTSLRDVDLKETDLSGADLTGADLQNAKLFNTNLSWTILEGASFQSAQQLGRANFEWATGMDLSGACYDDVSTGWDLINDIFASTADHLDKNCR